MKDDILKKLKHPLPLSILAGILNGTSYIPFPPWAVFFCLTPLFYIWITQTPKKVFLYTALTYFIGILIGFFWINHLLMEFAFFPIYISLPILILFAFFFQIHIAVAGFIWAKLFRPWAKNMPLGAGVFCALAFYLTPTIFPWHYGYTWLYGGLTGYQFADIIGFDGLNIITILMSAGVLWALISKYGKALKLAFLASIILTFNLLGFMYGKGRGKADKDVNVLITQANIGNLQKQYQIHRNSYKEAVVNKFLSLSKKGLAESPDADVMIWPETAFPEVYYSSFFKETRQGKRLNAFLSDNSVNLISGFYINRESGKTSNGALLFNRQGLLNTEPVYKTILLAFGEYIPFEKQFPFLRKILKTSGDFERGEKPGVRSLDGVNYGLQICYESVFPSHNRALAKDKAQIVVNLTNDSWYGKYSQPKQHLYLTAARAVESRLPLIRSTNTGISTVILPSGKILEQSPLHEEGVFNYVVPYSSKPELTIYTKWGWVLPLPFMLLMFILSFITGKEEDNEDGNAQSRLETSS